ncbi:hypothetical protein Q7453_02435 [Glaesserella parasuis]|nr:hypothetical protein [Glaesserella parasuis]MDO9896541.1 hypothetical protein [Glaesserella parasuis]
MNALDQLQQTKSWLDQTDEKTIDAFATQHATLVQLFAETLLNFRRGIENVKIIMPTEKTTVQKTSPTIQLENAKQDEPYFLSLMMMF